MSANAGASCSARSPRAPRPCCSAAATGCRGSDWFPAVLGSAEQLNRRIAAPGRRRAPPWPRNSAKPTCRRTSAATAPRIPTSPAYQALAAADFARLPPAGGRPGRTSPPSLSLAELRALPSRTQITRHDCVEGWSAIGKWKGARAERGAGARAPATRGSLRGVPLRRSDGRGRHAILREHRPRRRLPCADDPRLRPQRRAAAGRQRRTAAPARRAPARLQDGQVHHAHRAGRRASPRSAAAMAATGKTRATSGTRGSEGPEMGNRKIGRAIPPSPINSPLPALEGTGRREHLSLRFPIPDSRFPHSRLFTPDGGARR